MSNWYIPGGGQVKTANTAPGYNPLSSIKQSVPAAPRAVAPTDSRLPSGPKPIAPTVLGPGAVAWGGSTFGNSGAGGHTYRGPTLQRGTIMSTPFTGLPSEPVVAKGLNPLGWTTQTPLQLGSQLGGIVSLAGSKVRQAGQTLAATPPGNGPAPVKPVAPIYSGGGGSSGSGGSMDSPISTPTGSNVGPAGTTDTGSSTSINPLLILGAGALAVFLLKKKGKGGFKL